MNTFDKAVARIAGVILLLAGAGLLALASWGLIGPGIRRGSLGIELVVLVAILLGVGLLCVVMGFRLATNLPNRHGSLASPLAWYSAAALLVAFGAMAAVLAIRTGKASLWFGVARIFSWRVGVGAQRVGSHDPPMRRWCPEYVASDVAAVAQCASRHGVESHEEQDRVARVHRDRNAHWNIRG